ncbi:MAG: hypothetical protein KDC27_10395 [Acidobacteria bacterium]|nr:hypothetical protein [Acidobacteriota bacterium]
MPKSTLGAWRSFSPLAQADISTAQAAGRRYDYDGDLLAPEADEYYTNEIESTGSAAPTNAGLITRKFEGSHASKLYPDLVAMALSTLFGTDDVTQQGASSAYQHEITPSLDPDSCVFRTVIENDGTDQFAYPGVTVKTFKAKGERKQFVTCEMGLMGRGQQVANAISKPANSGESYLSYKEVNFYRGGTFNGTSFSGATLLSAALISFEAGFDNNATADFLFGDASGLAGAIAPNLTSKYKFDLSAKFEMEDRTMETDLLAQTEFPVHIPMVGGVANGGYNYTVDLIYPRCRFRQAKPVKEEGRRRLNAVFQVLEDPTYGAFIARVINLTSSSYVATS